MRKADEMCISSVLVDLFHVCCGGSEKLHYDAALMSTFFVMCQEEITVGEENTFSENREESIWEAKV